MSIRNAAEVTCPTQKIESTGVQIKCYGTDGKPVCTRVINASGVDVYRPYGRKPIRDVQFEELVKLAESRSG